MASAKETKTSIPCIILVKIVRLLINDQELEKKRRLRNGRDPFPPRAAELHDSHGQHVAVNSSSDYITGGMRV